MLASITHRATGIALTVGLGFLCVKLFIFGFFSADIFDALVGLTKNEIFRLLKFGFLWSIIFHLVTGVRHLIQDFGILYGLRSSRIVAASTFVLTTIYSLWFVYF